ncbi:MAG: PH domain-containing protein [Promethearchaeota archaeon]
MSVAPDAEFDKDSQKDLILPYLIEGEELKYVFDEKGIGSGFVAMTNLRLIWLDKSFVTKKKIYVTIPYNKIKVLGVQVGGLGKGFFSSSTLEMNGKSFEFRGADKATKAYRYIVERWVKRAK